MLKCAVYSCPIPCPLSMNIQHITRTSTFLLYCSSYNLYKIFSLVFLCLKNGKIIKTAKCNNKIIYYNYQINGARSLSILNPYLFHSLWLIHNSMADSRQDMTAAPFQTVLAGSMSFGEVTISNCSVLYV